jgi:hypothetical protein
LSSQSAPTAPAIRRPRYLLLSLLAAAALLPVSLPAPAAIPILAIVFGILPGAIAARITMPSASRTTRLLVALAISPFLAGGIGALLMGIGTAPAAAGRIVAAILALGAVGVAFDRRPTDTTPAHPGDRDAVRRGDRWILWIAGAWTVLIAAVLLGNRALIFRSDGWFHAAVSTQIAQRGLPPEDPFFAGLRLFYFWGPHAWASLWNALQPGLSVWAPFAVMNLAGAFASILGIGLLARRVGATPAGMVAAAATAILGNAPFAWGWIVGRAWTGEVRGFEELARLTGNGLEPALSAMSTGMLHVSMVFFGGKFLVLTPFGLGFGIFAAFLILFLDFVRDRSPRQGVGVALLTGAALFVHTVIGICCVALAAGWWGWTLLRSLVTKQADARRPLVPLFLAIAAGGAIASPYLASILGGGGRQMGIGVTREAIVTWIWGGAIVVPAGMLWLARAARRDPIKRDLLMLAILLTLPGLLLVLTDNNQSKFFNLLFYMLSAPAGIAWLEICRRRRGVLRMGLILALAAATIPTAGLSLWAYASETGSFVTGATELTAGERSAFAWARAHTPSDAIFVEETASRDATVLAGRSVLWGGPGWAHKWGYPDEALRLREQANRELSAATVSPETRTFLSSLHRPVIIVARRRAETGALSAWMTLPQAPESYRPIYMGEDVRLYELAQTTSWRR